MFKFVVLFAVMALAVANPGVLVPAVHSAIVPGPTSISGYETTVVNQSPVYTAPLVHTAPLVVGTTPYSSPGYHHIHKRSIGITPVSYSSIISPGIYDSWLGGYGSGYVGHLGAWNRHGLGYSNAIVHPY